jgi:dipeptide/tripeptide permease
MSKDDLKDEYADVSQNIRHWQNMRFAQLTVFIAAMAGLMSAMFQTSGTSTDLARISLKVAGLVAVAIFWVMDERVVQYWRSYRHRAVELENELGFKQHSATPPRHLITAGNAVRLLFVLLLAFWVTTLVLHSQF